MLFDNGQKYLEFQIPNTSNLVSSIAERVEEIKKQYPKMEILHSPKQTQRTTDDFDGIFINVDLSSIDKPHPRDIEKYNSDLESFYNSYEEYLNKLNEATELNSRTLELKVQLVNDGTAPVEDVTVFIEIPVNRRIVKNPKVFRVPKMPPPPEKPSPDVMV